MFAFMERFFERLDGLVGIEKNDTAVKWLERTAFVFLILMVASAPHSIAATQTAWIIGMLAWIVRLFFKPRVKFRFGPLDAALWAFFIWSALTSIGSYAPDISVDKLRGTAVFLIFYFVIYNVRNLRSVHFLAYALIVSCMVNVLWVPVERLIGRGVEIHGLAPDGPLAKALLWEGDTLLTADGRKLRTPEDVLSAVDQNETTKIKFYRPDFEFSVDVKRADILAGSNAIERLGFASWKKSRNWRSSGFYGHYTTYAEVLQLIASLVLGLLVAWFASRKKYSERRSTMPPALLFAMLAAMCLALLLTVTRAPQLGFIVSAGVIVLAGLGRKWLLRAAVIGLPIVIIGLLFLQQSRQVGFFDPNDDSIKWRQTVWQEGFDLWTSSQRNFVLGVGMDSIKRYAGEWHLFDDGRLNMGHFHSTPLQLLVERGLFGLLIWLIVLGIYARTLWRGLGRISSPIDKGILLGCLGGAAGFFASSLVHYNLGDQEVAMVFFILMGFGVRVTEHSGQAD